MLVKDKIAFERKKRGISSTQLGEMVGLNQGTISRYETGSVKFIPIDTLKAIVEVLDCNFDDFVCDDPKYSSLSSKQVSTDMISDEEKSLLTWFRNLPDDLKMIVKQLWNIHISTN